MKLLLLGTAVFVLALPLAAQTSSPAARHPGTIVKKQAAREEAFRSFRDENPGLAIGHLEAALDHSRGAKDSDYQLAVDLVSITTRFYNAGDHAHAASTAQLALQRSAAAQPRLNAADRGGALALSGEIYDFILRNPVAARAAYQEALALNPKLTLAEERLRYLNTVETLAAEKAAANDVIRQRAVTPKS